MGSKGLILVVEDNAKLSSANSRALKLRGYETLTALTLAEARERLVEQEPDVILLDVMMPDGDGFSFCKEIRGATTAHILFLTAKNEHEDIARGLSDGGDDYITKPFHPEELLLRVNVVMCRRLMDKAPAQTVTKGALTLNVTAAQALLSGRDMMLTSKEFSLLLVLTQNENKTVSAEDLYMKVWNTPMAGDKNTLQATVSHLRKKIEASGYGITVLRGQGYVFEKI